ncbi:MAG: hypothetical protein AB7U44_01135 [Sulfuricurvum sp.]|uniref:hypothetical protein n=1 Tax=Sulfuricurvum sp. TaxID=2025608 RepID=UPI0026173E93|nr:hypothetical protein [Sulfuricurvum sp.]MDD2837422.1 hypothetical protein [Sulfuricurvum sp.]MDD3596103.1 hypothetical protein [Sulfuricurvum sp.]MDD4884367.1 hypothetical protein [Sulfuricurvum sp.]
MEHHVVIEKLCSCAKKEGFSQIASFETKDSAHEAAQTQLAYMQGNFCGKHEFQLVEVNDNFVIGMVGGCGCKSDH